MCEFCMRHAGNGQECGKDYTIHPCANGDLGVRAEYIDGGIVLFKEHNMASGYFDINYCPICGRRIGKETDSEPVPVQKVLEDMTRPWRSARRRRKGSRRTTMSVGMLWS